MTCQLLDVLCHAEKVYMKMTSLRRNRDNLLHWLSSRSELNLFSLFHMTNLRHMRLCNFPAICILQRSYDVMGKQFLPNYLVCNLRISLLQFLIIVLSYIFFTLADTSVELHGTENTPFNAAHL